MQPRYTLEAASRFGRAEQTRADRLGRRRTGSSSSPTPNGSPADIPGARLERIEDSYTFVSIDQPERTAELIAAFAREPVPALELKPRPWRPDREIAWHALK